MNIKKTIKKISAIATGAALLGATATGAVSADLGDFPAPVVQDGQFDGQLVIGSMGTGPGVARDMAGAASVAASLQSAAITPVSVSGGATVSNLDGGEVYDDEPLNSGLDADELTEKELAGFQDTSARVNSQDIDYEEVLSWDADALEFTTSLQGEEDFGANVFLTVDSDAIFYRLNFEDAMEETDFDDDDLEVSFLGRNIEIESIDVANNEITLTTSDEFFLEQGDTVEVDGNTIELVRVGESSVIVEVNGESEVINNDRSKRFSQSDNFEVEVDGIFYVEGASDNGATLTMGDDLTRTVDTDDPAELFGEPDDRQDAEWLWDIDLDETSGATGTNAYIGLKNNKDRVELNVREDRERPALAAEESFALPNNYVDFTFEGLEYPDLTEVLVTIEDSQRFFPDDDDAEGPFWSYEITTPGEDSLLEVDGNAAEAVYVVWDDSENENALWYFDGDDDVKADYANDDVTLEVRSEVVDVSLPTADLDTIDADSSNTSEHLVFNFPIESGTDDALAVIAEVGNDFFGEQDEDEAGDLKLTDASGTLANFGTTDYDLHTTYGVFIEEPESQFGSGSSFSFSVPEEQQKATLTVTTSNSQRTDAGQSSGAFQINPLPFGQVAVLDSDVSSSQIGSTPMIVVGGPWSNSVADTLLGEPSDEDIEEMFTPGEGKLMWFEDEMALLVAGYEPADTVAASNVLANYRDYDLSGDEVTVITQDLSTVQVN